MKFGAIDIGSNGARLLISRVLYENSEKTGFETRYFFKDVEYTRFPLRLGEDVFQNQKISDKKIDQILKLIQAFKLLMELYEVEDSLAMATSAFREASNGADIVKLVKQKTGVKIEVISGAKEAEILNQAIKKLLQDDTNYLHIDVGGGSTELNLFKGRQKFAAKSFPMGSVRNTESRESVKLLKSMHSWLDDELSKFIDKKPIFAIGTGGNINKVYSLIGAEPHPINLDQIREMRSHISRYSFGEKINILQLNPDRADTIVPATMIYISVMEWAGAEKMIVPQLGLKDGMMEVMLEKYLSKQTLKYS